MSCRRNRLPGGTLARRRGRRGTSMVEFVLCIPLLALVIMVSFFFGWAMSNQQHVKVSGRYAVWRQARGMGVAEPEYINHKFFEDKAGFVAVDSLPGTDQTLQDMVASAGNVSAEAQIFADHLVLGRFPRSMAGVVAAEFPSDFAFWNRFQGTIEHRHAREGVEWRRGQADCEEVVRDDFMAELDAALRDLEASPAGDFSQVLRRLYTERW